MATSRLELPARKLLATELQQAVLQTNPTSIDNLRVWKWTSPDFDLQITFGLVWLQGLVTEVFEDGNALVLDDSSGKVHVRQILSIPHAKKIPELGRYVMVVGEVLEVQPQVRVKPLKVQDLSGNIPAQGLWHLEVSHMRSFLKTHYNGVVPLVP